MQTATQKTDTAPPDAELVERFRSGDAKAFDAIVTRHRQVLYLTARRLLPRHEDADEAAQMAFVRAWRALDGFRGDSALRTWLIRIVLNVAKSIKSSRRPEDGVEEWSGLVDPAEGSEERMRRRQLRQNVRRAVQALAPRQREVVTLKVFGEMTYGEVAGVMGLSEGAVKAHLHQAISNLRRRMGSSGERGSRDG